MIWQQQIRLLIFPDFRNILSKSAAVFQGIFKGMVRNKLYFPSKEKTYHVQFQSAIHYVSILGHPAWSLEDDLYYYMMQQLFARHHRIQQVVNKATFSEIMAGRQGSRNGHLTKYEDCRYELKADRLHEKNTCSYGADFNLSKEATGGNRIQNMCFCRSVDPHILDCKTAPVECSGDGNVPSLWTLALRLLIDNQKGVFHFNTSRKERSPTKSCANFISCPKHRSSCNSVDMPCHGDIEQLCTEPVSETELLSIKQPAIQGEKINEEEKNCVDRLWYDISSPTIRSLWMEDMLSTRFGALPDSLSHVLGELNIIVKVTDFLNREPPIPCDSAINENVEFSDSVAKHLLGDLFELLEGEDCNKKHTPDPTLPCNSELVHSAENVAPNQSTDPPIPNSMVAENSGGQSTDNRPSSDSTEEGEVEFIDTSARSMATSASMETTDEDNSHSSKVNNRISQDPFFSIPRLPLATPQLRLKVPSSPPFYLPKFQHRESGQYDSLSTPPRSFLKSEAASSRFYYSPFMPITFENPACLRQEVSPRIRPIRFPVAAALSLYPAAIQLQQPYLSAVPTVQVPPTPYHVDHNLTANSGNIQSEGSPPAMEYRVNATSARAYYPPLSMVHLRSPEVVTPLVPEYHQSRVAVTSNQNLPWQYQSSAVFQRTYVPVLPCRAIFIPTIGQYYPQNYQKQQNFHSHYIGMGKTWHYTDPPSQSQKVDKISEEATVTDTSCATSLNSYPNTSTTPSTLSATESQDKVERGCNKTTGKHQPFIKKKSFKTQQKILSYKKTLWKSVRSENKPRNLKLSDFLLTNVSVTSAFAKRKHKKKISTSEYGENNNSVDDIQKSREYSTSCSTDATSDFFGAPSMPNEHFSDEDFESAPATVPDKTMIALDVPSNCVEHDTVEEQSSTSCSHYLASDTDLAKLHSMKSDKVVDESDRSMFKESLRNCFETSYSSGPSDRNEELLQKTEN